MARDLFLVPTDAIAFTDIQGLISDQAEEGIRLEFKATLPAPERQIDRWVRDQSGIGRYARDEIAKEIIAFANAYGGVVVIGIDETEDNPKRAKAIFSPEIPQVADCAPRLAQALRDIIDPPLPMLEVRGIPSSEKGDGVIVIKVTSSPSAPHGFGRPPMSYIRRGPNSEPLTMRDLQSMFFERRTRIERVEARRKQQSIETATLWDDFVHARIRKSGGDVFQIRPNVLLFRCSLIPTDDMGINNFPDRFARLPGQRAPKPIIGNAKQFVNLPELVQQWMRRYRAVEHSGTAGDTWFWSARIEADGVISQWLILTDAKPLRIFVSWYAAVILQGIVLAEWMRRWTGRIDVEYVLDGEFVSNGSVEIALDPQWAEYEKLSWLKAKFGPYSVGNRNDIEVAFDIIERELCDLLNVERRNPLQFKWGDVFRSVGVS